MNIILDTNVLVSGIFFKGPPFRILPQKRIAELFDADRSVVTKHLRNIFSSNELQESSVCALFAHTAEDGKEYKTKFYTRMKISGCR